MKFSVIIPTYNRADLLEQAIQSVLAQTCRDFELLVVDDGSEPSIRPSATDARLRVLRHPVNRGAAAARNTGIRQAQGELVAFLDSDDVWFPDKLEIQAEFMRNASYDACVTSYEHATPEGFRVMKLRQPQSWLRALSMGCTQAPGTTLVVRRVCYTTVGLYDETMSRHEDYDWLLRFVQKFNLGVLETPLAQVRLGQMPSGTVMQAANSLILERYSALFYRLGRFAGSRAVGRRHLETAVFYSLTGDKANALKFLWYALRANPFQHPGMCYRVLENLLGLSLYPRAKKAWAKLVSPTPRI